MLAHGAVNSPDVCTDAGLRTHRRPCAAHAESRRSSLGGCQGVAKAGVSRLSAKTDACLCEDPEARNCRGTRE